MSIKRINIITHNCNSCSGFCAYCNARIEDLISQGFNLNDVQNSLRSINERNYKEAQWDFEALEKKLINHPLVKDSSVVQVTLWGADPFGSFDCLQENVDFLKSMGEKYNKKFIPGFCTNGLGCFIDEWVEYLLKENIHFTLSHDGLGQEIRTIKPEFDCIVSSDGFKELFKHGNCRSISSVLNQYNSDPIANYEWYKENLPSLKWHWRISKSKNGLYDVKASNRNGLCNGKYYEELKNKPYGDMLIHNDYDNPILRSQLDIYLNGLKRMYEHLSKYPEASDDLIKQARINSERNEGDERKNNCFKFQNGMQDWSATIDTLGKDCDCMLMDSKHKARFEGQPDYCKNCKYKNRYECNECNVMEFAKPDVHCSNFCEFNYRYMELMDYANVLLELYSVRSKHVKHSNVQQRCGFPKGQNRQNAVLSAKTL